MSRMRKKYTNGQSRGKGHSAPRRPGRAYKNYHRQEVAFHGSESSYERWVGGGRKGYRNKE